MSEDFVDVLISSFPDVFFDRQLYQMFILLGSAIVLEEESQHADRLRLHTESMIAANNIFHDCA